MELKLLRRGSPARAVITEVRTLPSKYDRSYRVIFEFQDEAHNATKDSA